jgi:hypothetical protein
MAVMSQRLIVILCAICALGFVLIAQAQSVLYREYVGDFDTDTIIRLSLEEQGQKLRGVYFYKKSLRDIRIDGEYTGPRQLVLREYNDRGEASGSFQLEFTEPGKEILSGTWESQDKRKRYPVHLRMTGETRMRSGENRYSVAGATDPALVELNAQAFCASVLKGRARTAVRYVSFPLSFNDRGKIGHISNSEEFLRLYSRIFTASFVARIREGIPHNMFANADGIRLGSGEVWFDERGKVIRLDN